MALDDFDRLFTSADRTPSRVGVAIAGGADRTVLEAVAHAVRRGWITPYLFGDRAETQALATSLGIDTASFQFEDSPDPARAAVQAVREGTCALLMKGQIATPALMKAVLDSEMGLRSGRAIAQVVLMHLPRDGRCFLLADTGITPRPTLDQKLDILQQSVLVAHALGEPSPAVAVMAASEKSTPALPDTLEADQIQRKAEAGELPGCQVQGPLSFDLAYGSDAAQKKGVAGAAVGGADIMLFPDLTSGNLTVKAIMYTAECRFGGVLVGTQAPVVFMSRADTTQTRLHSLALALRVLSFAFPGKEGVDPCHP